MPGSRLVVSPMPAPLPIANVSVQPPPKSPEVLPLTTDATGVELPEHEEYDTVSGLIMARLGRVADIGDEIIVGLPPVLDQDGTSEVILTVLSVDRHVPGSVRISQPKHQEASR